MISIFIDPNSKLVIIIKKKVFNTWLDDAGKILDCTPILLDDDPKR